MVVCIGPSTAAGERGGSQQQFVGGVKKRMRKAESGVEWCYGNLFVAQPVHEVIHATNGPLLVVGLAPWGKSFIPRESYRSLPLVLLGSSMPSLS